VLGAVGAVALLPLLAAALVRSTWRRGLAVAGGVVTAAFAAGIRDEPLPLTGDAPPVTLGLAGAEDVRRTSSTLLDAAGAEPGVVAVALVLAAAAALFPVARERGPWWTAGWGGATLAAALVPVAGVDALPLVVCVWATCALVWLEPALRRAGARRGGS
jgi:hypothetical protein